MDASLSERFRAFSGFHSKLEVQQGIADILDTRRSIEQTEALIAKYQQIKAGLMHDLFTRGVTPDGKLRPTRAEAPQLYKESPLGWIPKEWQIQQLGTLAEIVSGVTLGSEAEIKFGIEIPYLRVANVQDGYLDLHEIKTIRVSFDQLEKLCLKRGDVLMNEGGDYDKLGRGTVWNEEIYSMHPSKPRLPSSFSLKSAPIELLGVLVSVGIRKKILCDEFEAVHQPRLN